VICEINKFKESKNLISYEKWVCVFGRENEKDDNDVSTDNICVILDILWVKKCEMARILLW
jgi:hypothetical protein